MSRNREIHAIAALVTVLALGACSGGGSPSGGGANFISSPASYGSTSSNPESGDSSSGSYRVGGTVSGLSGSGLTLQLNGGAGLAVAADGSFAFPVALPSGTAYAVTVSTQPSVSREICSAVNGSGTVGTAGVTDVAISCSTVIGFLYQLGNNEINSYGIATGTGIPIPFGSTLATGAPPTVGLVAGPGGKYVYTLATGDPLGPGTVPPSPSSISTYAVNSASGLLTPVGSPISAGNQPLSWAMASSGFLFVWDGNNVTGQASNPPWTLAEYSLDPKTGMPTLIGTALTLPPGTVTSFAVSADGRFLYVLNGESGANTPSPPTLTAYAIDPSTGAVTQGPTLTVGNNSGTLTLDPLGRFLYLIDVVWIAGTETTGTVLSYAIDAQSGALTPIGAGTPVATMGTSLAPDPTGQYLYLTNILNPGATNGTIQGLSVASTGSISTVGSTLVTYQPFMAECDPSGQFVYALDSSSQVIETYIISTNPGTAGQLTPSGPGQRASAGVFVVVE